MQKILNSVLIKPSGPDCNMNCDYCFYLGKAALFKDQTVHRMSERILKTTVKQVMEQGSLQVSFGWQGGEPTLMGIPFFERAIDFQRMYGRKGQTVGNGLQTNGVLIDENWARFLKDNQFLVGLSLDGPEHIHNRFRRMKGGETSWDRVVKSRDELLKQGVEVNALIVVNDYSVHYPEEMYQWHKSGGLFHQQYIPCVEPDPAGSKRAAPYSVAADDYGQFLCTLFDLWTADFKNDLPTTSIRWFDSLFYTYVNYPAPECTLLSECGIYLVIEHNGDVYACDFFVLPEWRLGNVSENSLTEMLNSDQQNSFGAIKSCLPPECSDCVWLQHCFGGCPKDRQSDPRDHGSNHFCQAYKIFFEHADNRLHQLADQWLENQRRDRMRQQFLNKGEVITRNDPCPCGSGKKYKKCCGQY